MVVFVRKLCMYTCIYVHIYIYILHIYIYIYVYIERETCISFFLSTDIHVYIYVYIYIYILGALASPPTPASVYRLWAVLRVRIHALVKAQREAMCYHLILCSAFDSTS